MDFIQRSISKFTSLCINKDAKIATIRAVIVAVIIGGLLLALMRLSDSDTPDFTTYEAGEPRKEAFFSYFVPLIEQANQDLLDTRSELIQLREQRDSLSYFERNSVLDLAEQYEVEDFDLADGDDWNVLIRRIDIVPPSLALAQAANESAWGTSRFALEGNNYYGHWCFVPGCGIVPSSRPEGATHEVADFNSPQQSVERYIHNLNHHPAYRELRIRREQLRENDNPITGLALAGELERYSERGEAYIEELQSMIRFNELSEFDNAYF